MDQDGDLGVPVVISRRQFVEEAGEEWSSQEGEKSSGEGLGAPGPLGSRWFQVIQKY